MKKQLLYFGMMLALTACANYDAMEDNPMNDYYGGNPMAIDIDAPRRMIHLSNSQTTLAENGNDFAMRLLAEAADKAGKKDNVFISPLSLQIALGMLSNGLSDTAYEEMVKVMYGKKVSRKDLNDYYGLIYEPITHPTDGSICCLSNSIWLQKDYTVKPAFLEALKASYDSRISYVDYVQAPGEAKEYMNAWAKEATDGLIPELSVEVNPNTRFVLLNATLLRTAWEKPFVLEETKSKFYAADKTKSDVAMMKTGLLSYVENDYMRCVSKYYGNGTFYMSFYQPLNNHSVADIIPHLYDKTKVHPDAIVNLRVPKFGYKTCNNFIPMLEDMGVKHLFSDADALSGVNDLQLEIGQILQDTYINVHELGTEAAAVTEIDGKVGSNFNPEPEVIDIDLDHPFVFTICETSTGIVLFAGCVNKL